MVDTVVLNMKTALFSLGSVRPAEVITCINGERSLPGETKLVDVDPIISLQSSLLTTMLPAVVAQCT